MVDLQVTSPDSKPPLGGWLPSIRLTEVQAAVLNAAADEMIPGGDGFPVPSQVGVVSFIAKYVTPAGVEPKWYPFLGEGDLKARLDALGAEFAGACGEQKVLALQALERDEADFFTRLRDVVYYAYYSRPEVIRAINLNLTAGRDYRYTPQPYGYSDNFDDWDDGLLSRVRGTYKRTEDVKRLPLPADLPLRQVSQQPGERVTAEPAGSPASGG
ncbi:gluconate 2-dehydrogenase subunit 3 family protein [Micromonospora sp. NPDC048930]|uniref:gluconate 2-dehydrogenase subunit 3 family protein n=1 Tax=Micromonospora sp. NPDC048930 TaxID=3364261 RepID=UPI003713DA9B